MNAQIMDVTLRDGGYALNFQFSEYDTKKIGVALENAGIKYIELAHGMGIGAGESKGCPAMCTDEEYLAAAQESYKKCKYGVICVPAYCPDIKKLDILEKYGCSFVRIGSNPDQIPLSKRYIEALGKEKGINSDILFQAVEEAVVSAYKKNYDSSQNVRVEMSKATGEFHVFEQRRVVEQVVKPHDEISLEEALKMNPDYILGDIVEQEVFPKNFSRVAVQNAKQIIMQRIREAERNMVYDKFSEREDDIVNGMIQRVERGTVYVDLGSTEGILLANEQVPGERYLPHDRMKFYIIEVKKTGKGPQIMLSRTHPGLLKRLFELEVPEIHDGIVELRSIAREAGMRSKISVFSNDEKVDPVGSCVGHKGMRVQNIVNELRGEKIDIVKYNTDPAQYVANALSPAQVVSAEASDTEKICWVVVPDYQLSLAIGKEGQNARLAAKLTGWKIDIKPESHAEDEEAIREGSGEEA